VAEVVCGDPKALHLRSCGLCQLPRRPSPAHSGGRPNQQQGFRGRDRKRLRPASEPAAEGLSWNSEPAHTDRWLRGVAVVGSRGPGREAGEHGVEG
jgi:hypothetical protein